MEGLSGILKATQNILGFGVYKMGCSTFGCKRVTSGVDMGLCYVLGMLSDVQITEHCLPIRASDIEVHN